MNRAALLLCLAVVPACTADEPGPASGQPAASPVPAFSTPAPNQTRVAAATTPTPVSSVASTAERPGVAVNAKSVAGVRIGTPAAEAERRLRAALGKPTKTPLPGCYGETGHYLSWDTLTVYLSDSASGPVLLTGWNVEAGPSRFRLRLPYDVAAGDSVRKVLTSVPDAEGSVPTEGANTSYYIVHTRRTPGLTWTSTTADRDGRVADVDFKGEGCD